MLYHTMPNPATPYHYQPIQNYTTTDNSMKQQATLDLIWCYYCLNTTGVLFIYWCALVVYSGVLVVVLVEVYRWSIGGILLVVYRWCTDGVLMVYWWCDR